MVVTIATMKEVELWPFKLRLPPFLVSIGLLPSLFHPPLIHASLLNNNVTSTTKGYGSSTLNKFFVLTKKQTKRIIPKKLMSNGKISVVYSLVGRRRTKDLPNKPKIPATRWAVSWCSEAWSWSHCDIDPRTSVMSLGILTQLDSNYWAGLWVFRTPWLTWSHAWPHHATLWPLFTSLPSLTPPLKSPTAMTNWSTRESVSEWRWKRVQEWEVYMAAKPLLAALVLRLGTESHWYCAAPEHRGWNTCCWR